MLIAVAATIQFNLLATLATGIGALTDMATVVVYNEAKDQFVTLANAAARSALTYNLSVPADFSGDDVQCYISFVAADGKTASDSSYLGEFTVLYFKKLVISSKTGTQLRNVPMSSLRHQFFAEELLHQTLN